MKLILLVITGALFTALFHQTSFAQTPASGQTVPPRVDTSRAEETHEERFRELLRGKTGTIKAVPPARIPSAAGYTVFPNVDISADPSPQNEPSIRISHGNPDRMVAAWRDFRTGVTPAVRRIGYSFSNDGGATWSAAQLLPQIFEPAFTRHSDPAVAVDTAGNFYIATVSLNDADANAKLMVFRSALGFDYFDQAGFVPTDTLSQLYDKEYIECDLSPGSPYVNNLYIAWAGPWMSRSTDAGATWADAIKVSPGGSGAPDLCVGPDGLLGITSVRNLGGDSALVLFDASANGGLTFGADVIIDTFRYDFDCLSGALGAGFPSIAADISSGQFSGDMYAVWADAHLGDYDIVLKASTDGGATWSDRRRVNDDTVGNGKQQVWPWIAVDDRGVISIVYYDPRNSDDCEVTDTYVAYSWDGGRSFTNVLLTTAQSPRNMPNPDVRYGDYIGIDSWGGRTVPVWTDERAGGFDMSIYTAVLDTLPMLHYSGFRYDLPAGWNLVSLPVVPANDSTKWIFPGTTTGVTGWTGAYEQEDRLVVGNGYWIKYPLPKTRIVFGDSVRADTVAVTEGWNLVGCGIDPVPVASIASDPPALVTGPFYGYSGTYETTDTLFPGMAYWVKSGEAGALVLGGDSSPAAIAARIIIQPSSGAPPPPPSTGGAGPTMPLEHALLRNYPNPFNPTTTISTTLAEASRVTVRVFNVLGEMIATVAESAPFPAGRINLPFDGSGLPGGVYVCRILATAVADGHPVLTGDHKMLLVR